MSKIEVTNGAFAPPGGRQLENQHKQAELPVYLFKQGNNFEAYRFFGAHFEEQGGERGVVFRTWAPHARAVSVVGDFNRWVPGSHPMQKLEDGVWEAFILGFRNTMCTSTALPLPAMSCCSKPTPTRCTPKPAPPTGEQGI